MTDLYDLSPLLRLMLLGSVIALGPLAWVWWRSRGAGQGRRLQALTVLTLFLTFDLVMFGSFTRLTDSGLGCPDWPGCYGSASPLGAHSEISAAQQATVLQVDGAALAQWLQPAAGHALAEHLYVVDPMGNWMMRFPAGMDAGAAAQAKKDLDRLLRASASWDNAGREQP